MICFDSVDDSISKERSVCSVSSYKVREVRRLILEVQVKVQVN